MGSIWRAPFRFQPEHILGKSGRVLSLQVDCVLRVCQENVDTVFRVLLIFTFCFQHEPLEDVITPRNDATCHRNNRKRIDDPQGAPYFQS